MRNIIINFEKNAAAQATQIDAMTSWGFAHNNEAAKAKIAAEPEKDHAGIIPSVYAGLAEFAEITGTCLDLYIEEIDLTPLAGLTAADIVQGLVAIHKQWVNDNFTPNRLIEKHVRGQLGQYRKTADISWDEVSKDLLFVKRYLELAGSTVTEDEIKTAFQDYADQADDSDPQLDYLKAMARKDFGDLIIPAIQKFISDNQDENPARAAIAAAFKAKHMAKPVDMLEDILNAI